MAAPAPLRLLPDGTPCWCADYQPPEHSPKCVTLRAFAGVKGSKPSWLKGPAGNPKSGQSPALKRAFLAAYATGGVIRSAVEAAGIHRDTVDNWRKDDPNFSRLMETALEDATDLLEQEARRRAYEGWDEPVFWQGNETGVVRKFDSALITLLLKGRRPKVFGTERRELSGPEGGPIQTQALDVMDDHERLLLRKVLEDAIKAQEVAETA